MRLTKILAGATVLAALTLFIAACTGSPGSRSIAPSAITASLATTVDGEICDNGIDDNGNKLVDCDDPGCASKAPECQKKPSGCSPGFYKNHTETWQGICCGNAGQPSCSSLLTALTCKGSDASCGRSAAAAYLDACTGCSE